MGINRNKSIKIVSGGQTGVDRGALDGAMEAGLLVGGWCPKGRKAEDGIIDARYHLTEHDSASYIDRTRQNVIDSDATLIVYFGELSGGTLMTLEFCKEFDKAYLLIDANISSVNFAVKELKHFIKSFNIKKLNVAGPRASKSPNAYKYAKSLILKLKTI